MPASTPRRRSSARSFRTPLLPIPHRDWPEVAAGRKTEIRWPLGGIPPSTLTSLKSLAPIPVVGYTRRTPSAPTARHGLLVCDGGWVEPLGAIAQTSIEAEGFETVKEFRRYWRARYNGKFDGFKRVWCFKVRPYLAAADEERFKDDLYRFLILDPFEEISDRF